MGKSLPDWVGINKEKYASIRLDEDEQEIAASLDKIHEKFGLELDESSGALSDEEDLDRCGAKIAACKMLNISLYLDVRQSKP